LQEDVAEAVNNLVQKVLTLTPKVDEGTRIIDVTSASTPEVKRRVSTSSATTIDIACPSGT
jgi:hypothetical protein